MKALIIYDNTGKIWVQMQGSYTVPTGIPYLEVEIPTGKYPISVDVSGTTHTVVYAESPKSETVLLREDIDSLYAAVDFLLGV